MNNTNKKYSAILIVDTDGKRDYIAKRGNGEISTYSLEHLLKGNIDICSTVLKDSLQELKGLIEQSESVFLIKHNENNDNTLHNAIVSTLDLKEFHAFDYDVNHSNVINESLSNAVSISKHEAEAIKAEFQINKLFKCEVSKILQWYFHKEQLAQPQEIASISLSFPALTALEKIMRVEERIDNFVPEELKRVGIIYEAKGTQFRAINKQRFKKDQYDEMQLLVSKVSDSSKPHIVQSFTPDTKNVEPPKPLTTRKLEEIGVSRFRFSMDYTLNIAKELREGRLKKALIQDGLILERTDANIIEEIVFRYNRFKRKGIYMASFEQHVNGAVIGGGLITVLLHSSGEISISQASILLGISILGGILPDLDSDNSKPIAITFRILSVFLPLLFLINLAKDFTIVSFLAYWLGFSGVVYMVFYYLFLNLTSHRGIFHSIPMGIFFAQATILGLYYFVNVELYFATLCGLFLFMGFMIHLLLDELVSLNALGMSIKKSFGSALKLYDSKNKLGSVVLYILIVIQTTYIPKDLESYKHLFEVFEKIRFI